MIKMIRKWTLWLLSPFYCFSAQWDEGTSSNLFIKYKINEDFFMTSRNNIVSRDFADDFFFGYTDFNLGYKFSKNGSFELGYRFAKLKLPSGMRKKHRPLLNLSFSTSKKNWFLMNRHRIEWRNFEGSTPTRERYRNETRILFPYKFMDRFRPYAEQEFFYEFNGTGYNENWLTSGISFKVNKEIGFKIGYRWQSRKVQKDWKNRHLLVTGCSIVF